jgi:hypothetical protein
LTQNRLNENKTIFQKKTKTENKKTKEQKKRVKFEKSGRVSQERIQSLTHIMNDE